MKKEDVLKHVAAAQRGIAGYYMKKSMDPVSNFVNQLGCTIGGFSGTYNIKDPAFALAIRKAVVSENEYATYVICNVANAEPAEGETRFGGYRQTDEEAVKHLLAAGWEVLAKMRGAHGKYVSYLMGAHSLLTEADFDAALAEFNKKEVKSETGKSVPNKDAVARLKNIRPRRALSARLKRQL